MSNIDNNPPGPPENINPEPTNKPDEQTTSPAQAPAESTTEQATPAIAPPTSETAPTTEATSTTGTANTTADAATGEPNATDDVKPLIKRKTLSIIIHDAGVLRAAYMQFVRGGGLFIPTKKTFNMGEDTNLVIRLLDEAEPYRVTGKVVWITPAGSPNNKAGGIGVEFAEDKNGERLRSRIEVILGPYLKSTEGTHTM